CGRAVAACVPIAGRVAPPAFVRLSNSGSSSQALPGYSVSAPKRGHRGIVKRTPLVAGGISSVWLLGKKDSGRLHSIGSCCEKRRYLAGSNGFHERGE